MYSYVLTEIIAWLLFDWDITIPESSSITILTS